MRTLVVSVMMAMLLTGCGLQDRFDSAENRINQALPPDSGVRAARQLLLAQIADQPALLESMEPKWAARMRLRALSCSQDYTPSWRETREAVRARLVNASCFAEKDRALQRWIGLQRAHLILGQGPLRPLPPVLPSLISHNEFIISLAVARAAPVAIMQGNSGFQVVSLATGEVIFKESIPRGSQAMMSLSPNGRLFTQSSSGNVAIRASAGGETLVELPQTEGILWLDNNVVVLRSINGTHLRLLDLSSGEESPVPGATNGFANIATPAPGAPNRFNLLVARGAVLQLEIVNTGARYEAQLRAEKQAASGYGFAINTGGMSSDGSMWVDGSQSLRVLDLDSLALVEKSFAPLRTQMAWPTSSPQEFILSLVMPSGNGVTSIISYHLYNHRAGTLAPVTPEPSSSTRYQYLTPINRLAVIEGSNLRYIDQLNVGAPLPVDTVVARVLDEMNQRRIAAATAQQTAAPGLSAGYLRPGEISAAPMSTPLQAQLREAQVEGVGVYQGGGASQVSSTRRPAGVVEVRVRRSSRPIALVLASYEPVRWVLVPEPGARLSAVLLSGYYESTVMGAGAARVYAVGRAYAYGQTSPGFTELQRDVVSWAGKPMTVFQGRYEGSSFSVGGGN